MTLRPLRLSIPICCALIGCATRPVPPPAFTGSTTVPYTLGSGDKLRIIVFGQDNLSNIYSVDTSGRIAFPLTGAIPVNGQTTQQVERTIEARLRGGFVREPRVTVDVETFRPFFILGEVTNAGQFPYVSGLTVQTAVAVAGGFSARAVKQTAELTRLVDGKQVTASVPIEQPVFPGDTIVVRERFF